jgi:UDP-GlcNAc:undecaprenyl-phosphate GlcNAc-1-phosphate transferase
LLAGDLRLAMEVLILAGAVAGFLMLNLRMPWQPRARAFMGDAGGMLLGLLLGWYAIKLAGFEAAPLMPMTAVWILALPLLDMGSVMLLRIRQGKSPFHADRQHLHHVLLDAGYSVNQVVMVMAVLSLFFGLSSFYLDHTGIPEFVFFWAFIAIWIFYYFGLAQPQKVVCLTRALIEPVNSGG